MIEYLNNVEVKGLIDNAPSYQKAALTGLRNPQPNELGKQFTTYVLKDGLLRVESNNTVTDDVVVARNPGVIGQIEGKDIYNEWLVPKVTAIKNYGESVVSGLGTEITEHKKQATIQAVEITPEILKTLGVEGDVLNIKVSWSSEPMVAHLGDFITDSGYSVSSNDMKNTYEPVSPAVEVKNRIKEFRNSSLGTSNKVAP